MDDLIFLFRSWKCLQDAVHLKTGYVDSRWTPLYNSEIGFVEFGELRSKKYALHHRIVTVSFFTNHQMSSLRHRSMNTFTDFRKLRAAFFKFLLHSISRFRRQKICKNYFKTLCLFCTKDFMKMKLNNSCCCCFLIAKLFPEFLGKLVSRIVLLIP